MATVSAFRWVPPFAQGLVRDLRVRWTLEELGRAYEEHLVDLAEVKTDPYLALQPFGQVPAYQEEGLQMFESGAIVLHLAERSEVLMPADAPGRARVKTWAFAALNSIEPHVMYLAVADLFHAGKEWTRQFRPVVLDMLTTRLEGLARRLRTRDYLEDRFTAADLLMTTVLRDLRDTDLVTSMPALARYQQRCEARPAFQRALNAQMATFLEHAASRHDAS